MLEIALAALGVGEVLEGRAARRDCVVQDVPNDAGQGLQPGLGHLARRDQGRDAGAVQGLADINIAQARHHLLVQQADLDILLLALEGLGQMRAGKAVAERLGSHGGEPGMVLDPVCGDQAHEAEAARVRKAHAGLGPASDGAEAHVLVLAGNGRRLLELAQLLAVQGEAAGHAQVTDPGLAGRQRRQQVLGPPVDPLDHSPLQPLDELFGEGKAQVGPVLADVFQRRADQHRFKSAPDGFDLGKLRHGRRLALPGPVKKEAFAERPNLGLPRRFEREPTA